jgi:hypothetical protein
MVYSEEARLMSVSEASGRGLWVNVTYRYSSEAFSRLPSFSAFSASAVNSSALGKKA